MLQDSDKEQIEQLKKLWNEYGRLLLIAIVVGVGIGFAWQYWQKAKMEKNLKAAVVYQQYSLAELNHEPEAQKHLESLRESYSHTAYATFAALNQAAALVQQNDYEGALKSLQWVQVHTKVKELKELAILRMAQVYLALHQAEESLRQLAELRDSIYKPMAYSLEGDAYAFLGKTKEAQASYQVAQAAFEKAGVDDPMTRMKANSPVESQGLSPH